MGSKGTAKRKLKTGENEEVKKGKSDQSREGQ